MDIHLALQVLKAISRLSANKYKDPLKKITDEKFLEQIAELKDKYNGIPHYIYNDAKFLEERVRRTLKKYIESDAPGSLLWAKFVYTIENLCVFGKINPSTYGKIVITQNNIEQGNNISEYMINSLNKLSPKDDCLMDNTSIILIKKLLIDDEEIPVNLTEKFCNNDISIVALWGLFSSIQVCLGVLLSPIGNNTWDESFLSWVKNTFVNK